MATKADWKEARARLDAIIDERESLLAPTKERYDAALEAIDLIEAELGDHIGWCEGCSHPLFEGDRYHSGSDVYLCEPCAPSFADMVERPDSFLNVNDEPMTAEEADAAAQAHLAGGGSLSDKMVSA
jgi:hypothetical protein